jgi:4a-hydroxytetrahydrobiopterin dehydratase
MLSQKKCLIHSGNTRALDKNTLKEYFLELKNWQISSDARWIFKEFKFKNFVEALEFVKKVALISESEQHHPNINFTWGYCKISIQTHKINQLCENDFILAAKIDLIC